MADHGVLGELVEALERWVGARVAVRVVSDDDELIVVIAGRLGAESGEKHPALFWPLEPSDHQAETLERPGIYAHPELVTEVRVHVGQFVVEYAQAGVTTNLRRLEPPR